ncbi:PAS domain S-box protein [Desulfonatronum parangueonense]
MSNPGDKPFTVRHIPDDSHLAKRHAAMTVGGFVILAVLFAISRTNFLLFHTLVELGAVAVAWGVFLLVWNARHLGVFSGLVILGIGYVFVGLTDLLHTLAYKGMNVLSGGGSNMATQLWLAARYLEVATLGLFALALRVPLPVRLGATVLAALSVGLLGTILWWGVFPVSFDANTGLTPFKNISEYVIIVLLGGIGYVLWQKREILGTRVTSLILGSIVLTMLSEYCFTLYDHPYALANMTGHFLKVGSIFLLYRALIVEGLHRPLETLVRERSTILDQTTDAIITTDLDLHVTSWNRAATRIYGWSQEEAVGKPVDDLLATEFIATSQAKARAVLEAEGAWRGEVRQKTKGGRILVVEASVSWLTNGQGKITGGITVNRDITRRKGFEEALQRSEQLYKRIVETSQEGIWMIDSSGRTIYTNKKMADMLGYAPEEMLGTSFLDLHFSEDVPTAKAFFQRRREGIGERHDARLHRKDGSELWTIASTNPLYDVEGRFEGALGMFVDITERRRIEEQLRESQSRYQAVVNDQTELICRSTPDGLLNFVNPAYCQYFGLDEEELLGKSFLSLVHEDDREFVNRCMTSITRDSPIATYEQRVVLPDGRQRWQEWTDRIICDVQGNIVEYQSVGRDVTDRKALEQRLFQAREQEQRRLGQELHDGLCQDLKGLEIETALLENACMRGGPEGADKAVELGRRINQAVRAAYDLARGLLPLGIDAEGLSAALADLAHRVGKRGRITVIADIQGKVFPPDAKHALHIFRIAQEALGNAVRHSGCGKILVSWTQSNNHLLLEVQDDGHGFEPSSSGMPATGIGLIVMHSRAQAMGAALSIHSRPGQGTRIRCGLPIVLARSM